jgi:hypothetical protein
MKQSKSVILLALLYLAQDVSGNPWRPTTLAGSRRADAGRKHHRSSRLDNTRKENAFLLRGGDEKSEGKATITASVFNLVNYVAGAGILSGVRL